MTVKIVKDVVGSYLKAIDQLDDKAVKSGLLASAGTENIQKGITNEFGVPRKRIPERSFIRSTFDDEKENVTKRFKQIYEAINKGDFNVISKLRTIGIEHAGKVKQKIADIKTPRNSAMTIALKGFDNPLIHTGAMRSKVSSEVINK